MFTSEQLEVGSTYTRDDLKRKFNIKDATLNTGIFKPRLHDSVWLFVTENKSPDRIQYVDRLVANTLYWEGQLSGRKDRIIYEHKVLGLELLVFYRKNKNEFPGAGFRYEGRFGYVSRSGSHPTRFVLEHVDG